MIMVGCSSSPKVLEIPELELPIKYRIAFNPLPALKTGLANDVLLTAPC